jgi:MraZ protein
VVAPAAPAEVAAEPEPPTAEPLLLPLNGGIELMRLDVEHGESWMQPAAAEEAAAPQDAAPPPALPVFPVFPISPEEDSTTGQDHRLLPLCPRANLLQPVPDSGSWTETLVRRPPAGFAAEPTPHESLRPPASRRCGPPLPWTGTYPCRLTDSDTLYLPQAVRDQLAEAGAQGFFLRPDPAGCLWLCTPGLLETLARQGDRRLVYAQAERCPVDAEGQAAVPRHLLQAAGLELEVVLIGARDHFELWSARRWQDYVRERIGPAEDYQPTARSVPGPQTVEPPIAPTWKIIPISNEPADNDGEEEIND